MAGSRCSNGIRNLLSAVFSSVLASFSARPSPGRGVTTSSTRLCPTCISAPRKGGMIFPIGSSLGPNGGHVPNLVIRDGVRPLGTPPDLRVGVEGNQEDCLQRKGKGHWVGQAPRCP